MDEKYYAHSLEGKPPSDWQPLEEHLQNVAKLAADFMKTSCEGIWRVC